MRQIHLQLFCLRQLVQLQVLHDHLRHCYMRLLENHRMQNQMNQQILWLLDGSNVF